MCFLQYAHVCVYVSICKNCCNHSIKILFFKVFLCYSFYLSLVLFFHIHINIHIRMSYLCFLWRWYCCIGNTKASVEGLMSFIFSYIFFFYSTEINSNCSSRENRVNNNYNNLMSCLCIWNVFFTFMGSCWNALCPISLNHLIFQKKKNINPQNRKK